MATGPQIFEISTAFSLLGLPVCKRKAMEHRCSTVPMESPWFAFLRVQRHTLRKTDCVKTKNIAKPWLKCSAEVGKGQYFATRSHVHPSLFASGLVVCRILCAVVLLLLVASPSHMNVRVMLVIWWLFAAHFVDDAGQQIFSVTQLETPRMWVLPVTKALITP